MNRGGLINGQVLDAAEINAYSDPLISRNGDVLCVDLRLIERDRWVVIEATEPEQLDKLAVQFALAAQRFRELRAAKARVPA